MSFVLFVPPSPLPAPSPQSCYPNSPMSNTSLSLANSNPPISPFASVCRYGGAALTSSASGMSVRAKSMSAILRGSCFSGGGRNGIQRVSVRFSPQWMNPGREKGSWSEEGQEGGQNGGGGG